MTLRYEILPVTPFQQNCTLLWCEATRRAAVVDAGGDLPAIVAAVERLGLTVDKLLLTHGHIDHAGAAAALAARLGVEIEGPQQEEAFWLDQLPQQGAMFGFPPAQPLTPQRWLEDGDQVSVGEEVLEVRHCPGHTPGHVVFISHTARLVIAGDVLFQRSIGRTDFPRGDFDQLAAAIRGKLFTLPDDYVVLPGHGPSTTIGEERLHNPFVSDRRYG